MRVATIQSRDIGRQVERECAVVQERHRRLLASDARVMEFAHASSYVGALEAIRPWAEAGHVSRLAQVTSVDRLGVPNYYATRPASLHKDTIIAGGKGLTDRAAMLSALFEAFERWAGERHPGAEIVATLDELRREVPALPIAAPRSIPIDRPIAWTVGIDLITEKPCCLPLQRTIFPMPPGKGWLDGLGCDTTGLASGTHPVEAICSAFLELIERDATSQMTLSSSIAIDPSSVPPGAADLVRRFSEAGIDLRISYLASITGIAVFHAFSRDDHLRLSQFFCSGAGAHPRPEVALTRALTEVAQSRSGYITTIRDDVSEMAESLTRVPYEERRADLAGWFETREAVSFDVFSGELPATFKALLEDLLDRVRRHFPDAVVAWVPLQYDGALHACRLYCPQLRNPSIDLL